MRDLKTKWRQKRWGITFDTNSGEWITNLRFADDILILAATKYQATRMLEDLVIASRQVGLEVHMGKTKFLTNVVSAGGGRIKIFDKSVDILPIHGSTEYLGRRLCFGELHDAELQHRIDKARKKFFANKAELCCKHIPLKVRLRFFQSTVSSTLLYGAGTWTMNAAREAKLQTAQRKMLRWMVGSGRRTVNTHQDDSQDSDEENSEPEDDQEQDVMLEPWEEWVRRVTHFAEEQLRHCSMEDWIVCQRRRKWKLAGHLARRVDGRWSTRLLAWVPVGGRRHRGHPVKRWRDDVEEFLHKVLDVPKGAWTELAMHSDMW
eukprot:3482036-Karenia_brevis.AAC.1